MVSAARWPDMHLTRDLIQAMLQACTHVWQRARPDDLLAQRSGTTEARARRALARGGAPGPAPRAGRRRRRGAARESGAAARWRRGTAPASGARSRPRPGPTAGGATRPCSWRARARPVSGACAAGQPGCYPPRALPGCTPGTRVVGARGTIQVRVSDVRAHELQTLHAQACAVAAARLCMQ